MPEQKQFDAIILFTYNTHRFLIELLTGSVCNETIFFVEPVRFS